MPCRSLWLKVGVPGHGFPLPLGQRHPWPRGVCSHFTPTPSSLPRGEQRSVLLLVLWSSPKAELEKRRRGPSTGCTGTGPLAGARHALRLRQALAPLGQRRRRHRSRLLCHRCRQRHGTGSRLARAGGTAGSAGNEQQQGCAHLAWRYNGNNLPGGSAGTTKTIDGGPTQGWSEE